MITVKTMFVASKSSLLFHAAKTVTTTSKKLINGATIQPRNYYKNKRPFSTTMTPTTSNNRGGTILKAKPSLDEKCSQIGLRQLFDDGSCTYTYLLWDKSTKDAILVDPVDVQVDRDLEAINSLGLNLVYAVNTHAHADHITGTGILKQRIEKLQSVISEASGAMSDVKVANGDKIVFGGRFVEVRATPGHTVGCVSFVADDESFVLTGDSLLVQGCGRTDFQGGSAEILYDSVHGELFSLGDATVVYPAHDYKSRTCTTIGAEKGTNPRLGGANSKTEFAEIMNNLNLSYPKKIDVAVPANMRCGVPDV